MSRDEIVWVVHFDARDRVHGPDPLLRLLDDGVEVDAMPIAPTKTDAKQPDASEVYEREDQIRQDAERRHRAYVRAWRPARDLRLTGEGE